MSVDRRIPNPNFTIDILPTPDAFSGTPTPIPRPQVPQVPQISTQTQGESVANWIAYFRRHNVQDQQRLLEQLGLNIPAQTQQDPHIVQPEPATSSAAKKTKYPAPPEFKGTPKVNVVEGFLYALQCYLDHYEIQGSDDQCWFLTWQCPRLVETSNKFQ